MWLRWGEEYFQSRLSAPSRWGLRLPAPKGFTGKRKSGSRFVERARLRFCCPRIPSPLGRTPQVATSGNILLWRNFLHSSIFLGIKKLDQTKSS